MCSSSCYTNVHPVQPIPKDFFPHPYTFFSHLSQHRIITAYPPSRLRNATMILFHSSAVNSLFPTFACKYSFLEAIQFLVLSKLLPTTAEHHPKPSNNFTNKDLFKFNVKMEHINGSANIILKMYYISYRFVFNSSGRSFFFPKNKRPFSCMYAHSARNISPQRPVNIATQTRIHTFKLSERTQSILCIWWIEWLAAIVLPCREQAAYRPFKKCGKTSAAHTSLFIVVHRHQRHQKVANMRDGRMIYKYSVNISECEYNTICHPFYRFMTTL